MNKYELIEGLLFSGLRLLAVVFILVGGIQLLFQLVETWYRFDPNYLVEFLFATVFRPVVMIIIGAALCASARWMACCMAKPFRHPRS